MILAHIAGVPVQESLAFVLPVVLVVGFIYWSSYRERRRARGCVEEADKPPEPLSVQATRIGTLPEGVPSGDNWCHSDP